MSDYFLRKDCRLCGSNNLVKVLELTPTPPANSFVGKSDLESTQARYPLDLYCCRDCTHVQLCDVVDPRLLFEHYVYVSGTSSTYRKHLKDYADDVSARYASKGDEILEIGSNDGVFLKFFQESGFKVHGVDPARNIGEIALKNGIPTTVAFFGADAARKLKQAGHRPKIILANHVFAHIDNLRGVMNGVVDLLEPGGFFIFEVSYLLDVVESLLFDTIYHEHVAYHSVKALQSFLDRYGFDIIEVQRVEHQGGSLRSFAQKRPRTRDIDKSVKDLLELEKSAGLDRVETYAIYGERLNKLNQELNTLLSDLKGKGKKIAGFGAPAKATTLMYHFGLGRDVIGYIVDDNPLKQGLYTPGLHVPVLPASTLYERHPDYIIVLAWNFADSIMRMQQRYIDEGGSFIVPLPKLRVVNSSNFVVSQNNQSAH